MAGLRVHSVLVTGSNRGIGLELVKTFLGKSNPPKCVFASCRDPHGARAQELRDLASKHSNLVLLQLDVTDPASIAAAAKAVGNQLEGSGLNLVINNAGIMTYVTLETVDSQDMLHVFNTNVVGPMLVSQAFLPLLKKAAQENPQADLNCGKAALIHISSTLGSIERIPEGKPVISYRVSKAALNMLMRCQAKQYKEDGILCAAIHPGWVKTDMGTQAATLTTEKSVSGILGVLESLSEKHNGILLDWQGATIPW
ncbi:uncharacterized protein LOC115095329 [Rhinatrema bivittatum]|uniref:uncharacterized protein LOC115095329 n=1 Tax=Rhinatrema bivittatum TaxID=194408 RepID=UPI00112873B6|nr:uncharacterized protein LOC115095329 [Rhinatrema bivittatum]